MNIEEILHNLEIVARKHTIEVCDGSKIETLPASLVDELRLNYFSAKLLSNYIDNKDKEIKELQDRINKAIEEINKRSSKEVAKIYIDILKGDSK